MEYVQGYIDFIDCSRNHGTPDMEIPRGSPGLGSNTLAPGISLCKSSCNNNG